MIKKLVALLTALCLVWNSLALVESAWAAESKQKERPAAMRTIAGLGEEGWAIVDVREVEGTLVVISPAVGREIDMEERNRFDLFHGPNVANQRINLPMLRMGIPGFQSAVFMKRKNGKPAVRITFRSGRELRSRTIPLRGEDALRRIREYIEHFDEIWKGEYTLGKKSSIEADADYPQVTEEELSFEDRIPRFSVRRRMPAQVVLKGGDRLRGDLMSIYEDDTLLMESDLDTRRIPVAEIDRLQFMGAKGSAAMEQAILSGVGGAATGALVGALSAWQVGGDVKGTAILAATIFGVAGFITGLMRGAGSTRGSREFVLGPVKPGKEKDWDREDQEDREGRGGR